MEPVRTRISIEDRETSLSTLIHLGFSPCGQDLSLLQYDDLLRSSTGVLAKVTRKSVVISTDRHANGHDRAVAARTVSVLRCRHPIRDSTDEE
ncbi:MAG: hypothetical protein AAFQ31_05585 [Planctomycetota bacterium]